MPTVLYPSVTRLIACFLALLFLVSCTVRRGATEAPEVRSTTVPSYTLPQISPQEALTALNSGTLLLDVREAEELAATRYDVPDQLGIPISELEQRSGEIPRDRPIIVACAAGGRSAKAIQRLQDAGYTNLTNLTGGLQAWEGEGLPVVKGETKN